MSTEKKSKKSKSASAVVEPVGRYRGDLYTLLGSVRSDKRKKILEGQAVTELDQEKALHQLAVERANRACERADAAEAERDAAREALAVAWEVGYLRGVTDEAGDMERADNPYLPATDEGAGA